MGIFTYFPLFYDKFLCVVSIKYQNIKYRATRGRHLEEPHPRQENPSISFLHFFYHFFLSFVNPSFPLTFLPFFYHFFLSLDILS